MRYIYDDSGDCCGEIALGVGYPMADLGELGAKVWYDPVFDTTWAEAAMSVGFVAEFEVGGTIGTDFDSLELGDGAKVAWNLGVSRGLADFANVDLRYYDSNYDPGRLVLSIGADFLISAGSRGRPDSPRPASPGRTSPSRPSRPSIRDKALGRPTAPSSPEGRSSA